MTSESSDQELPKVETINYFVDEAGDGVLFGPKGRNRLEDKDVDDKTFAKYGRYWTRKNSPPDPEAIKNRWI